MIEQRINDSLKELEQSLKGIESARQQVEKVTSSYNELKSSTSEYVSTLASLTSNTKDLIKSIGEDYEQKTLAFEQDRSIIVKSTNEVLQKLSDASVAFRESLNDMKKQLKIVLVVNVVTFLVLIAVLIMTIK